MAPKKATKPATTTKRTTARSARAHTPQQDDPEAIIRKANKEARQSQKVAGKNGRIPLKRANTIQTNMVFNKGSTELPPSITTRQLRKTSRSTSLLFNHRINMSTKSGSLPSDDQTMLREIDTSSQSLSQAKITHLLQEELAFFYNLVKENYKHDNARQLHEAQYLTQAKERWNKALRNAFPPYREPIQHRQRVEDPYANVEHADNAANPPYYRRSWTGVVNHGHPRIDYAASDRQWMLLEQDRRRRSNAPSPDPRILHFGY